MTDQQFLTSVDTLLPAKAAPNGWPDEAREAALNALCQTEFGKPIADLYAPLAVSLGYMADAALDALAPFLAAREAAARADAMREAAAYLHGRAKALRLRDAEDRGIPDHMGHSFEANAGDAWAAAILAAAEPPA